MLPVFHRKSRLDLSNTAMFVFSFGPLIRTGLCEQFNPNGNKSNYAAAARAFRVPINYSPDVLSMSLLFR